MFGRRRAAPPAAPPLDIAELLRQVRRLELRTRRLVDSRFAGEYHSVFKGQGIEFAEVREYLPGDDVRAIDWNVTARLGTPYVKQFVEERELTVMLAIDLSASQRWGTAARLKSELAAEVAATLALSASGNNDRVGLIAFTDRVELVVRPRKGRRHALRLLRDLLAARPAGRGTDAAAALDYVLRAAPARAVVFLLSDFQLGDGWPAFERALGRATLRHDVVPVVVADEREARLPDVGLLSVVDPETGRTTTVDTSSAAARADFDARAGADAERAARGFRRLGLDVVTLHAGRPYARPLLEFFRRRERRRRR